MGIRRLIRKSPDLWCIHRDVDWSFVNSTYKGAIVGGAGLLHKGFETFWRSLSTNCRVPVVVWGVGVCLPDWDSDAGVSRSVFRETVTRSDLVNVRDDLTANRYEVEVTDISPCPTVAYVEKFRRKHKASEAVLFVSHEELVDSGETRKIWDVVRSKAGDAVYTSNVAARWQDIDHMIREFYCPASLVVSTRLHGAVIAYGLGIPYITVPRDEKVRAFVRLYGNGKAVEFVEDLPGVLGSVETERCEPTELPRIREFAERVREWMADRVSRA